MQTASFCQDDFYIIKQCKQKPDFTFQSYVKQMSQENIMSVGCATEIIKSWSSV